MDKPIKTQFMEGNATRESNFSKVMHPHSSWVTCEFGGEAGAGKSKPDATRL